ncbi:MAG: ribonuclease R [Alphaproteobacteria bacterium]
MAAKAAKPHSPCPRRDDLLAYLRDREEPAGLAALARAFNVKGKDRTALRLLLRELEDQGLIEAPARRKTASRQRLGPVAVLEITGPDSDGELRARPLRWAEGKTPPAIYVAPERGAARALGAGERILARLTRNEDGSFDARPMRRLGAAPLEIIGVYRQRSGHGRINPTDRRAKTDYGVRAPNRKGAEPGDLVRARVLGGQTGGLREAEVIERIGNMDSPGAIDVIALHANDIPIAFTDGAIEEAGAARPVALEGREDLRDVPLVTIDGADARDFDDAVFAEPDRDPANQGGWRLLVAIADVAWYVRQGMALDADARMRGNSVYLPSRVVAMLPEALSSGLCSLKPGEERAVLTAEMRIDHRGGLLDHRFGRGLMRSWARLTYRQIQGIKDGKDSRPPGRLGRPTIENLYGAYDSLARARVARGTLELELPEFKVEISDQGGVAGVSRCERLASHRLVEEFMITANVAAAETLEKHRAPCMYRVHEAPDPTKIDGLRDFLKTFGLRLPSGPVVRAGELAHVLEKSAKQPTAEIIHEAILRCQSQAAYSPANRGHFGLALRRYAHFTSPIRRYADLLVHRALIGALGLGQGALATDHGAGTPWEEIGVHISDTERRAQRAERESMDRYLALYLEERIGARFQGRITGVTRFGLFVRLPEFGADGLVPARHLGDERWHHDAHRHSLEGMASGTVYVLGDEVEVELLEANPVTGGLILGLTAHRPVARRNPMKSKRRAGPGSRRGSAQKRGRKR